MPLIASRLKHIRSVNESLSILRSKILLILM